MTEIRIAATTSVERGRLFEEMTRTLLEGYWRWENVELNLYRGGYELDFKASSNEGEIIGECKARHDKKIFTTDILAFFAKFTLERRDNQHLRGAFYTLSHLTGSKGADAVLTRIRQEKSIPFSVYTSDDIVNQLVKQELVETIEYIEKKFDFLIDGLGKITAKKFHRDEIVLEYFNSEYYWVGLITEYDNDKKYFLLLDSRGNMPRDNPGLGDVLKKQDASLLGDREHLFQKDFNLDSEKLLSVVIQLDKNNQWKKIFLECIRSLEDQHDYVTIANIFEKIGECEEPELYTYVEDIGDKIRVGDKCSQ